MLNLSWTRNKFWKQKTGNGLWKIQFFTKYQDGTEKTHAIFERESNFGIQSLIENMSKWGNTRRGDTQKGWRLFNPDFVCWGETMY